MGKTVSTGINQVLLRSRLRFGLFSLAMSLIAIAVYRFDGLEATLKYLILVLLGLAGFGTSYGLWLSVRMNDRLKLLLRQEIENLQKAKDATGQLKPNELKFRPVVYILALTPMVFMAVIYWFGEKGPYPFWFMSALTALYAVYFHDQGKFSLEGTQLTRSPWLLLWMRKSVDLREIRGYRWSMSKNPKTVPVTWIDLYDGQLNRRARIYVDHSNVGFLEDWAINHLYDLQILNQVESAIGLSAIARGSRLKAP